MILHNDVDDFPDDTVSHPGMDSIVLLRRILETHFVCSTNWLLEGIIKVWPLSSVKAEVSVLGYRDEVAVCFTKSVQSTKRTFLDDFDNENEGSKFLWKTN